MNLYNSVKQSYHWNKKLRKSRKHRDKFKDLHSKWGGGGSNTVPGNETAAILVPLLKPTRTSDQITHQLKREIEKTCFDSKIQNKISSLLQQV